MSIADILSDASHAIHKHYLDDCGEDIHPYVMDVLNGMDRLRQALDQPPETDIHEWLAQHPGPIPEPWEKWLADDNEEDENKAAFPAEMIKVDSEVVGDIVVSPEPTPLPELDSVVAAAQDFELPYTAEDIVTP